MEIKKTRMYDIFRFKKENREINYNKVMNLKSKLINDGRQIVPIICNRDMEVIDGQHRLEALKELGYNEAKIKLTIAVGKGKGTPTVSVMTQKAGKTKTIEEKAIIDTGKIEKKELNELGEFVHSYTVSIKKLSDDFFVYYNSDNWGSDTWSCDAITMELEFVK